MPSADTTTLIKCPICGQEMKRITATHLNKHNMTMEEFREQYGDVMATEPAHKFSLDSPEAVQQVMDRVTAMIVSDEKITDMAKDVIQNLMRDNDPRLRISLNAMAVVRMQDLTSMYQKLTGLREALLDERRLSGMTDANLAKTYQILETSIEKSLNYLKSLSTDKDRKTGGLFEQNTVVNIFNQDPDAPPTPDSPAGREKLRALFNSLVTHAHGVNAVPTESPEIIEAKGVVVEQEPSNGSQTNEVPEPSDESTDESPLQEG